MAALVGATCYFQISGMYGCMLLLDAAFPDVRSVVRSSRMWCPHNIGRDSWVWREQETLYLMDFRHEVGEEALSERSPLSGGSGVARG